MLEMDNRSLDVKFCMAFDAIQFCFHILQLNNAGCIRILISERRNTPYGEIAVLW